MLCDMFTQGAPFGKLRAILGFGVESIRDSGDR
jgi:hypothetical protein